MAQQIDIVANLLMKVDGAESGLKRLQSSLSGLKLPKGLDSDLKKSMSNLEGLFATYRKQIEKGFDTKSDVSAFTKTAKSVNAEYDRITRTLDKLNGTNVTFNVKSDNIKELEKTLDSVIKKREELSSNTKNAIANDLANIQKAGSRSTKVQDYSNMLGVAIDKGQWQDALQLAQSLKAQFEGLSEKTQQAFAKMSNGKSATAALNDIIEACRKGGEGFDKLEKEGKEAAEQLANLQAADVEKIEKALVKMGGEWQESTNGAKALNGEMTELARSTQSMSQQLGDLQQSTQYFFSLRNMINLLKRGISDAVQTVKELDAAMTETAVVTDFSVGDMWAKLPEYTANANKLGATIQDMYESTTLYYQQGLNTEQSMAIAAETMKMARIAGLEAKDATDMMTAALRGFNMELNETSATRINDVYSNLAAKTASDTEEIGKAMQRTASIAHSAGMSFEGTAAFLAQAVETTREPAENIGTAMKTIVARFQEMKKNPLEITEVDGEEVSYNKVDAALQSIGVSLKDTNGQFRELDKVFLDISKKWNSLSQTQQRYIATIAAGSRQQSRFIAMMGDYDRTVELMSYANDSAGASQEQFNKTLDSLEAKLNKFKNAWDQFLMGIMNDSWVKGIVGAGTTILKTVNGIIDALSFGGKAKGLKSLLSIGTAGIALKAGGNLINKLIGGVGGFIDPASSFGKGFWGAGKTTQEGTSATGIAGKITTPIVAKLNELIAVTREANNLKNTNIQTTSTLGQYKNVSAMLRNPNSLNVKDIGTLFNGLSDEHAYTAFSNAPGTIAAMKQAVTGQLPAEMQSVGGQLMTNIIRGMKKKEIPVKKGAELIGKPQLWGKYLGTETAQEFSKQYIANQKELWKTQTVDAKRQAWIQAGGSAFATDEGIQNYLAKNKKSDITQNFISNYKQIREEMEYLSKTPIELDKFQQLANNVGILGSRFSSAGMSLQMFGSQLGQLSPALEGVGTLIARVGGMLNTFGMGVSGIGSIVTKIGGRIAAGQAAVKYGSVAMAKAVASGAVAAESTVAATGTGAASAFVSGFTGGMSAGPIAAIIAAVLTSGIVIAKGIIDKKAREAGEEVRENFEKGFTETNKKIDSLEGYKDRFNELSEGVDQFGHNISLTDEEFDEYLSISRELQELSPSLIAGYNAEGQAILRKGEALDEVISKLKEERDLSLENYISNDSVDKLIKAYNTSDAYKQHHTTIKDTPSQYTTVGAFDTETSNISKAIKQADLEWSDFSQILEELGIGGAESIDQLTNSQLSLITNHYIDILNKIKEANPQLKEEAEEGLKEAFAGTSNAIEDVLTEGAPIVDALHQWIGQEKLDAVGLGLSEEFVSGFNSGLDGLMLEGLTNNWKPEEYKAQLKDYANEWKNLAGPTSQYSTILAKADEIQQQYLDHIGEDDAVQNYEDNIEGLATQLESLAEQYQGTGAAGELFAEQCQQQANNLRNYATEGVVSLSEALNTLSDEFASARGAQERFQKATEGGDYYTAAEGYKSIIDTMLDEKNVAGNGSDGSLTFWAGADELLGQQFVDSHTSDEIVKQVEKIQSCFEDGLPGVQAFGDLLVENADKLKGLGEINKDTGQFEFNFKNLDDLEKYAELLGISEDALAALIDKSRQYVPWNLSDPGAVRKAIEDSQYSMSGTSTKGENLVYTSESQFRAEARQQGIRGDDYTKTKNDAKERGVRFLNVENLTAKNGEYANQVLDNIGLKGADKTLNNAVAAFAKMGFDLEDTKQILASDGIKLADGPVTSEQIEEAYNEQAYALENPTVAGIANDTGVIASAATALLTSMGILTDQAKKDIDQTTSDEYTDNIVKGINQDFTDSASRNAAVSTLDSKIAEYDSTLRLLAQGGVTEGEYVDKLTAARQKLIDAKEEEQKAWDTKVSEAQAIIEDKGKNTVEQQYLNANAVDIQNAFNDTNISDAAAQLRELEDAGQLSHSTMVQLATDFLQLRQEDLANLNVEELDTLCTKLGLTGEEATKLLATLGTPFVLTGRLEGENLKEYIDEYEGITAEDKTIFLRTDISGEEKVELLLDKINNEFGDGSEKTKTIILEAEAKLANGDQTGAEKLLADAGFNENEIKEITERLSITVDGSIANPGDVQTALNNELQSMDLEAEVKARVSAKLEITNKSKISDKKAKINYTTGEVQPVSNQKATLDYNTGNIPPVPNQKTGLDFTIGDIPSIPSQYVDIYPRLKGSGTYTVIANARGRGFSIPAHNTLSFGSAAQGMNLSKKRQIGTSHVTALVGEEGFEVGYIPSEQRSVIFGANGPEMTSFPSDTVIYPHKQSKEILRRGKGSHKSLGSFNTGTSGGIPTSASGGSGGSGSGTSQPKSKSKSKSTTIDRTLQKQIRQVTAEAGHVVVWWENMARRVESVQRQAEKNQKKLEGLLTKITSTTKTVNGTVKNYQKNLKTSIALNQREVLRANRELKALNTGSNKYYSQEDVSYEEKVNGKKESKEMTINLDRYIKYNKLFKNYEIDDQLLKKIGTWGWYDSSGNKHAANKSLAEAIKAAAEKAINDRVSKRNTAEDNVTKAREELKKLSKDIYDTFYGWETSLTKIWNITQKIETLTTKISRLDAGTSLLEAQIGSGMRISDTSSAQTDIQLFKQRLDLQNRTLLERQNAITQATQDVKDATSVKDENTEITTINDMLKNPKKYKLKDTDIIGLKERRKALKEQKTVITRAKKYLTTTKNADGTVNIDFNYEKLNEDRLNGKITADMAKAIEKYKDSIEEANNNLNEQRQALIEGVTEYYSTLKDLREQWADYEDQLIQITEENNKKELDQLKTLSDSVKQSLDDLLNDVKRKLDERRKQEDNANTERDISQKQQRLAMLRADTSGGHQVEIAQLEKEITEAQQNYQRSLEDQLLEKLQNQADEAAKQRERQIELQEKIVTSVNNIALVDMWMANPEQYREEIIQAYKNAQNYDEQGIHRQGVIDTDAEAFFNNVRTNQDKQKETLDAIDQSKNILTQIEEDLKWVGVTVENARDRKLNVKDVYEKLGSSYKSLRTKGGYTAQDFFEANVEAKDAKAAGFSLQELKDVGYNAQQLQSAGYTAKELKGVGFTMQDLKDVYTPSELKSAGFELKDFEAEKFDYSSVRDAGFTVNKLRESEIYGEQAEEDYKKIQKKYNNFLITRGAKTKKEAEKAGSSKFWGKLTSKGYSTIVGWGKQLGLAESQVATDLARTDKLTWKDVIKAAKGAKRSGKTIKKWYPNAKKTGSFYKAFESVFGAGSWKKYASGGLATQTGPAWLDGTPSKPELVLNAADTKNFLALKDVLAGAMKGMSNTSNTYGDILYEININVDKIEKDYDVDRVVEKVKKEITKGAGYRNVTQVRNFR